jgi:cytochrome c oxidase subunit 1
MVIQNPGRFRTCNTFSLPICLDAQLFIRLNAVVAVVFILLGAIAGLTLGLTRWPAVHLLPADWFYRALTFHGLNMLIFWILFMEMAILQFAGTTLLKTRLFSRKLAWISFALMLGGAVLTDVTILRGRADVMMTSYVPLRADPDFYLGLILFAVGALFGVINFFGCVYLSRKHKTLEGSMPLVAFGALTAAIIAVVTILHGAAALIPAWLWTLGVIPSVDAGWYRITWWGLGHMSQQVNVSAMISVWYLMATLTTGARPLNQLVSRGAFLLYILFINLASAHHLLVDPGVSAGWKIWNTSYAMYLAVLASMLHGFTVPSSVEVAMRARGHTRGLFGWLTAAPWKDPGFSAFFLSLVIFGFLGGITGVTLGTQQINIMAHNTLRIPGHFHTTVAGGTSLAFMGLAYYVIPLVFQKEFRFRKLARIQPYLFAFGITMMAFGMSFAGSYGVPRRHWDVGFSGAHLPAGFDAGAHAMLGVLGIGAVFTFLGVLLFAFLAVAAVFFGKSNAGSPMASWQDAADDRVVKSILAGKFDESRFGHKVPGTVALVVILLVSFVVYYFANWKALTDVWHVR